MYIFNPFICTSPTSISAYLWQNTWKQKKKKDTEKEFLNKQTNKKDQYSFSRKIQYNENLKHMLPSSGLRPKRQMCFNKSRQYEEKSFHFSLQIPVTAHLFHFPCLLCAVSARENRLSNQAPRIWCLENCNNPSFFGLLGNRAVPSRALLHFIEIPSCPKGTDILIYVYLQSPAHPSGTSGGLRWVGTIPPPQRTNGGSRIAPGTGNRWWNFNSLNLL